MAANDDESLLPISGWFISPHSDNRLTVQLDCRTDPQQPIEDLLLVPRVVLTASQAIALANTLLTTARFLSHQEQQGVSHDSRLQ